ncbi:MAG TPA: methylmalonyl-CoA mutase family protein, partial [Solirubrobacterales bacterium]
MAEHRLPESDRPWVMRTYAGHSDARRSNELYRRNLAKGQTGLSVAFDLPTQTGYDPDQPLARGEVGKVGVSIVHKGDMHTLLDGIPLDEMNTSMTINATAAWLLALYVTIAEENGIERTKLKGTTQNDIIKEYLSRGTYAFPPEPSMRLIADTVAFAVNEAPDWNPTNVCSYHLQEAGATPVQEIAYALSTAIAILDEVKARGQVSDADFPKVFGRISFFVNAGIRLIEEIAKLRAMGRIWTDIGRERYGVTDDKMLRFRYGVQVNSLGLTESQPENNVPRIVLEALAVTLSRDARARAVQLPAWNEALGLPRPWDQQWSLRIQQILAEETDLLEYPDIFEGSEVMEGLVEELEAGARAEMAVVEEHGGAVEAVPYMKARLVESHRDRVAKIERGELKVVGQNVHTETEDSPLTADAEGGIMKPDPEVERERIEALQRWREERDEAAVRKALDELARVATDEGENIMPATIEAAKAGATTGEWAGVLREAFGDYRAPTGVSGAAPAGDQALLDEVRKRVDEVSDELGHRVKILVGKPGLDGHSNGSEQVALRARDAGMEVIYQGIRLTPEEIAESALQEDVDVVGISILSGSHMQLVPEIVRLLREAGVDVPVVVGGIIPAADARKLQEDGVARVYT